MMADIAIKVVNVSKTFKLPHEKQGSVKGLFLNIFSLNRSYEKQKALQGISLDIKKGEFFGIIGRNGGGKSTLLKLLAGVYTPDAGDIKVHGKLTPFIELGVGFNPELTGRENVYLNGALLGFDRKEVAAMYNDIVEFAEIEKFMDQKLKNYSSGMQVRLAFSIAIRAKSDILLIDEVLAVGDINFQKKCIEVFEQLKREGRTIVFVSHAMSYVRDFCDRVAVISQGSLAFVGDTEKGIDLYNQLNSDDEGRSISADNRQSKSKIDRLGNGKVQIDSYRILNDKGQEEVNLETGNRYQAVLDIIAHETVTNCAIGIMFRKNPQENLYGINSFLKGHKIKVIKAAEKVRITFKDTLPLNPGVYYVSFAVAGMKKGGYDDLDNLNNVMKINVVGPQIFWGLVDTKPEISIVAGN